MLNKIIDIEAVGKFNNYHAGSDTFSESFKKVVAIYADNGSGKSTLTHILKSMGKSPCTSLSYRKSFTGEKNNIKISVLFENTPYKYKKGAWDITPQDIVVFDAAFVEDNIYVMTPEKSSSTESTFDIVLGQESVSLYQQRETWQKERRKCKNHRAKIRKQLKSASSYTEIKRLDARLTEALRKADEISVEIRKIDNSLDNLANQFGDRFINNVNNYLSIFAPDLKMTKLYKKANRFLYNLQIDGVEVRTGEDSISLKRTLSEGDKNSIAISFFLANLSLRNDLSKTIVVFDDPINSMDYKRRHSTKINLVRVAKKCNQFFLLSHDISFVDDFSDCFETRDILNLKIANNGKTAYLTRHDIKNDTLKGIFKDLKILTDFAQNRDNSKYTPRQVIRCIRPVLESILKIKYYGYIGDNKWLGDILSMIRDADSSHPLFAQKANYDEIEELNDYTSSYHHGDSFGETIPINSSELASYCTRTISLLRKI